MSDDTPWIVNTQSTLGSIVHNPKLSTKLLSRPPFKFLHDVVLGFMAKTKLMNGLFTPEEMDPGKAGADRESKLAYLEKLMTFLGNATNSEMAAKALNIVAGKEPEATNQALVALASLASMPPHIVAAAVAKTTGAAPPSAPGRSPRGSRGAQKPETPERGRSRGQDGAPSSTNNNDAAPQQQQAASSQQQPHAGGARPGTATARKAPPAVRSHETVIEDRNVEIQSVAGVIVENKDGGASGGGNQAGGEGGDNMAAPGSEQDLQRLIDQHENATQAARHRQGGEGGSQQKSYLVSGAQHQKEEEEARARKLAAEEQGGGGEQGGIRIKVQGRGDHGGVLGDSEITKLREQLQLLTKASNPLGKYLEAIFDDIDSMTRELDMWRNEARTQSNTATEAQRQTQESMREVNAQLTALDESIKDQRQKVSVVRAGIQKNEASIEKLIRMVINPSEGRK